MSAAVAALAYASLGELTLRATTDVRGLCALVPSPDSSRGVRGRGRVLQPRAYGIRAETGPDDPGARQWWRQQRRSHEATLPAHARRLVRRDARSQQVDQS